MQVVCISFCELTTALLLANIPRYYRIGTILKQYAEMVDNEDPDFEEAKRDYYKESFEGFKQVVYFRFALAVFSTDSKPHSPPIFPGFQALTEY